MKATLQKLISLAVLGVAVCSQSLPTWAGVATRNEVYISPGGTSAQGSMAGARYSSDSTQYIGCDMHGQQGAVPRQVYCWAMNKTGKNTYCYSTDPRYVDAVKGITDFSHIAFDVQNLSTRTCTNLTISNESIYLP